MAKSLDKTTHGGEREGAGRPKGTTGAYKSENEKRRTIGVRLPAYMVDWLKGQDESAGKLIEAAIKKAYGKQIKQ